MRFLHTADWQMGMKAAHVGAVANRVREERFAAAKRVVAQANALAVDFMLVAGDTFENNAVDRLLVRKVIDILAAAKCPVYLISGNHDPLTPGSVWEHSAWREMSRLHVIREAKPISIPGGILYPSPLFEKYSLRDPTRWIDARSASEISIGLAHGTLEGIGEGAPDYPISPQAPARTGLDYLAIGHWHSYLPITDASGDIRLAYSGTHETTKFGERESGQALLIEIESRGAQPQVTPIRTGGLHWELWEETLQAEGDIHALREKIDRVQNPENRLLDLRLSGVLSPREEFELTNITELLDSRWCFARIDRTRLLPPPADDTWMTDLPPGALRETAFRLRSHLTGEKQEVASQALLQLYRLAREAK